MLERDALWLGSWSPPGGKGYPSARAIADAVRQVPLGQARWLPPPESFWQRWFTRPTLEVVETEDDSLLFQVHGRWSRAAGWEVREADGRLLGLITQRAAFDPLGRCVASLEAPLAGTVRVLRSAHDQLLATVTPEPEGQRVNFTPALGENPFLRMLLLAVLLQAEE